MKRDFVALYEAGEPARKYISYKVADKEMEGKELGSAELAAPTKPGHYFARYLRADYSELAVSATIVVRSATIETGVKSSVSTICSVRISEESRE